MFVEEPDVSARKRDRGNLTPGDPEVKEINRLCHTHVRAVSRRRDTRDNPAVPARPASAALPAEAAWRPTAPEATGERPSPALAAGRGRCSPHAGRSPFPTGWALPVRRPAQGPRVDRGAVRLDRRALARPFSAMLASLATNADRTFPGGCFTKETRMAKTQWVKSSAEPWRGRRPVGRFERFGHPGTVTRCGRRP